jgi:glycosyltransferase involved in cell wall biosynthesis
MSFNTITIGLTFFNNEDTLEYAIGSILAQSMTNWELILINDGSTDGSCLIASKYANCYNQIKYINDGINKGLICRLNQIIDLTQSKYLVRMDADDIMFPNRIEKQISFLNENVDIDIVSSGAVIINQKNQISGIRDCEILDNFQYSDLFFRSYIIHPTAVFRTNWIKKHRYSEGYLRAEDLELWCRTFVNSNHFRIPEPLLFYREGKVSVRNYILSMYTKNKIIDVYGKGKLSPYRVLYLKGFAYVKIVIYRVFGFFNIQHYLTRFRNKSVSMKYVDHFNSYINSLSQYI